MIVFWRFRTKVLISKKFVQVRALSVLDSVSKYLHPKLQKLLKLGMPVSQTRLLSQIRLYIRTLNDKQLLNQFKRDWFYLMQKMPELFSEKTDNETRAENKISTSELNKCEKENVNNVKKVDKVQLQPLLVPEEPKSMPNNPKSVPSEVLVENNVTSNLSLLSGLKQRLSPKPAVPPVQQETIPKWKTDNPTISLTAAVIRTKHILELIDSAESIQSKVKRLEDLNSHLHQYPEARSVAVKVGAIQKLLNIRSKVKDYALQKILRETFALLGYVDPLPRKGIRILSIDGGGIRGIAVIVMLKKLEELTGKKIYELFDYICGVSTGSILVSSVGTPQGRTLDEAHTMYKEFGTKIFTQSAFWGVSNLVWSRAYYDTTMFEQLLKKFIGEMSLIKTNTDTNCPKLASISTVMNQRCITPFVFRNYELPYNRKSQYLGSCNYTLFESVRASGAAPTVFQEFCLDGMVHQDGGILVNNPCAVAIHEAKLLWPKSEIQCVVSCGTGRHAPLSVAAISPKSKSDSNTSVSWKILFNRILESATDTEGVHTMLNDLLPPNVYFRFNPYLTEFVPMHEIRSEKIAQLEQDTAMYIRKNEENFIEAANNLLIPRTLTQKVHDYLDVTACRLGIKNVACKL